MSKLVLAALLALIVPQNAAVAQEASGLAAWAQAASGMATPSQADASPTLHAGDATNPLLAKNGKKKKKKKKSDDGDAFGPDDIPEASSNDDSGVGVHREQAGVDHPYGTEFTGTTTIQLNTVEAGDASPQSQTIITVGGTFYFILGHMELGPALSVGSTTSQEETTTVDTTTGKTTKKVVDTKSLGYEVGPAFKWNFGNIDHDTLVPFVSVGLAYRGGSTKVGDAKEAKTTGSAFAVGGGINMFLSDHLAFQPSLEYRIQSDKGDGDGAVETKTSGLRIVLGLGTFL